MSDNHESGSKSVQNGEPLQIHLKIYIFLLSILFLMETSILISCNCYGSEMVKVIGIDGITFPDIGKPNRRMFPSNYVVGTRPVVVGTIYLCLGNEILCKGNDILC